MEIYQNKQEMLRKMKLPKYQSKGGVGAFFTYLFGLLIWVLVLCGIIVVLYVNWFSRSLVYLLSFIHKGDYYFPFWMALLITILAFPFSLIVVFIATLVKNFRK